MDILTEEHLTHETKLNLCHKDGYITRHDDVVEYRTPSLTKSALGPFILVYKVYLDRGILFIFDIIFFLFLNMVGYHEQNE